MPRFVEVAGCPCPAELAPFVREVMRRTGVSPVTIYRGSEPDALAIMHAHGKHSQAELYKAWNDGHGAQYGIAKSPDRPGTSSHELRSDGNAFAGPPGRALEPIQCGMDWPIAAVPQVIAALEALGCDPFRPYPSSAAEAQHVCCRAEGELDPAARLASDPLVLGDHSKLVRTVQIYLKRGNYLPDDFDVAEKIGTYGPVIVEAVEKFQREHGLDDDGKVGKLTFAALKRRYAHDGHGGGAAHAHPHPHAHSAVDHGAMSIGPEGLALIKRYEGFRPTVYDDGTHTPTIGYGETKQPLPHQLTEPQAAALLVKRLARDFEPAVRKVFQGPHALPFNQHRFDALMSFVYNLGAHALEGGAGFETLGHAIRTCDLDAICRALPLYSHASNPALHEGLLKRRNAEVALFRKPAAP